MFTINSPKVSSNILSSSAFTPSTMTQIAVNYAKQGGKMDLLQFP